jgi:hypothetical protein
VLAGLALMFPFLMLMQQMANMAMGGVLIGAFRFFAKLG